MQNFFFGITKILFRVWVCFMWRNVFVNADTSLEKIIEWGKNKSNIKSNLGYNFSKNIKIYRYIVTNTRSKSHWNNFIQSTRRYSCSLKENYNEHDVYLSTCVGMYWKTENNYFHCSCIFCLKMMIVVPRQPS